MPIRELTNGTRPCPADHLLRLFTGVDASRELDDASLQVKLLRLWDEAVGPELAPHCRPQGLRRGEILAHVRDSAWMQHLQLEKPRILEALKRELGDAAPTDLRLRVGD